MLKLTEVASEPVVVLCSMEDTRSSRAEVTDGSQPGVSSVAMEADTETCSSADYSEDIGEEPAQIPSVLIDATEQTPVETVEAPPAKRPRTSKNRKQTEGSSHAGESASHEAVVKACMEHLAELREHKTTNKRDDIAYFALRTDARLRALPIHVAQDLMHLMESMIYQAEVENRNTSN
ncbi:uncharacterized protein [Dermacentor andersoni]|uniref:uncharacterized protein isoform X1 n=1 Tax=Dermacentor andersoni TaxID=34620 RepID=UPI003B3AE7E7